MNRPISIKSRSILLMLYLFTAYIFAEPVDDKAIVLNTTSEDMLSEDGKNYRHIKIKNCVDFSGISDMSSDGNALLCFAGINASLEQVKTTPEIPVFFDAKNNNAFALPNIDISNAQDIKFSNDSKFVATCRLDGIVTVFDYSKRRIVQQFNTHQALREIAWARNDQSLITAGDDAPVSEWKIADGSHIKDFGQGSKYWARFIISSPESSMISCAFTDGSVKTWDSGGKLISSYDGSMHGRIMNMEPFPNGNKALVSSIDTTFSVVDLNNATVEKSHSNVKPSSSLWALMQHKHEYIEAMDIFADEQAMVMVQGDGVALVWDIVAWSKSDSIRLPDILFQPDIYYGANGDAAIILGHVDYSEKTEQNIMNLMADTHLFIWPLQK